jgi:hypothetical protein
MSKKTFVNDADLDPQKPKNGPTRSIASSPRKALIAHIS